MQITSKLHSSFSRRRTTYFSFSEQQCFSQDFCLSLVCILLPEEIKRCHPLYMQRSFFEGLSMNFFTFPFHNTDFSTIIGKLLTLVSLMCHTFSSMEEAINEMKGQNCVMGNAFQEFQRSCENNLELTTHQAEFGSTSNKMVKQMFATEVKLHLESFERFVHKTDSSIIVLLYSFEELPFPHKY